MLEALFFFVMKASILVILAAMVLVPLFLALGFIVSMPLYVLIKVADLFTGGDEDAAEAALHLEREAH